MLSRARVLVALLTVAALVLVPLPTVPPAFAATLTVNSTLDEPDALPGDGRCESTLSRLCTLRAAIMEANGLPGADIVSIPSGTYSLSIAGIFEDAAARGDLDITQDLALNGQARLLPRLTQIVLTA